MKEYDLNIEKILAHWDVSFAIREIIANALDEQNITKTKPIEIIKKSDGWHIIDYGRGLNYRHLSQNESVEKKNSRDMIGQFGVGLKDALSTFYRYGVSVKITSKHGVISIKKLPKHGFEDLLTLHAIIEPSADENMVGTDFLLIGCSDEDIEKAKQLFMQFSEAEVLEDTSYGQILSKRGTAVVYLNGAQISVEPDFLFSYNITRITSALSKALNRERNNIGRTAYTSSIESILLAAKSDVVIDPFIEQVKLYNTGNQCDEIKWSKIGVRMVQELNKKERLIISTVEERANLTPQEEETIKQDSRPVIYIPNNIMSKVSEQVTTVDTVKKEKEAAYQYDLVALADLSDVELANYEFALSTMKDLSDKDWKNDVYISSRIRSGEWGETHGVWDPKLQKIVLKRSILQNMSDACGVAVHEMIHATTGTNDLTRDFENELTGVIGKLSKDVVKYRDGKGYTDEEREKSIVDYLLEKTLDGSMVWLRDPGYLTDDERTNLFYDKYNIDRDKLYHHTSWLSKIDLYDVNKRTHLNCKPLDGYQYCVQIYKDDYHNSDSRFYGFILGMEIGSVPKSDGILSSYCHYAIVFQMPQSACDVILSKYYTAETLSEDDISSMSDISLKSLIDNFALMVSVIILMKNDIRISYRDIYTEEYSKKEYDAYIQNNTKNSGSNDPSKFYNWCLALWVKLSCCAINKIVEQTGFGFEDEDIPVSYTDEIVKSIVEYAKSYSTVIPLLEELGYEVIKWAYPSNAYVKCKKCGETKFMWLYDISKFKPHECK